MDNNLTVEVLSERVQNMRDEITNIKEDHVKLNDKVDKLEGNINTIERKLSDRMLTLETTYKLTTEQIKDEIKDVGKQIATLINKEEKKNETNQVRNYDWLKGIGLIIAGILITYVAKKLGL